MKLKRHNAIRDLIANAPVTSQDELRRKLTLRGFEVTQATLSRDIHEMRLMKGPGGYALPNGNGALATAEEDDDDEPTLKEMIYQFGLRVQQAMNQVVIGTTMGGASPLARALDYEEWPEIVGTLAGDDTILVICPDGKRAGEVEAKLRTMLES